MSVRGSQGCSRRLGRVPVLAIVMLLASAMPAFATSGVTSWGANEQGQLGNGSTTASDFAGAVSGLGSGVMAISAGSTHGLALLTSGSVVAWGENGSGELGDGTVTGPETCPSGFTTAPCSTTPVPVGGLSKVRAISAGGGMSLALLRDGTLRSWGSNFAGALGNGATTDSAVPVAVSTPNRVSAISSDGPHSLALLKTGRVVAWGDNEYGQLGDGTHTGPETCPSAGYSTVACSTVPVFVSGLRGVIAISAGDDHNLALLKDGTVMAWGVNNDGQLGNSNTPESDVPVPVAGLSGVKVVSAGGFFSLAVLSDGTVRSWGWNNEGQLGDGTPKGESTLPVPVLNLAGVAQVSAGGYHSLANSPEPIVTKVSPKEGPAAGGTTVTVTGTNLNRASAVSFSSTSATSFTVNSSTSITAVAPAHTPGVVDVRVTTPNGTSALTSHDRFKYLP